MEGSFISFTKWLLKSINRTVKSIMSLKVLLKKINNSNNRDLLEESLFTCYKAYIPSVLAMRVNIKMAM